MVAISKSPYTAEIRQSHIVVDVSDSEGCDTTPFPAMIEYTGDRLIGYSLDCYISADAKARTMDRSSKEMEDKTEEILTEDVKYSFQYQTGIDVSLIRSVLFVFK